MKQSTIHVILTSLISGDKTAIINTLRREACVEKNAAWANQLEGYASKLERAKAPALMQLLPSQSKARPSLDAFEQRVPIRKLDDMVLADENLSEVREILNEHARREILEARGLKPKNRLMFVGPSGCGKTMLAGALAHATGKTFHILKMGQLVDSYLGNTIRNVENSFAAINQSNGVFLFDEFDALATAREASQEVNEMRRALNSLLVHFEMLEGESIVIAATNHPQSLDPAFRRRFESILFFDSPTRSQREQLVNDVQLRHGFPIDNDNAERIAGLCGGMSFDETEQLTRAALVSAVLEGKQEISLDVITKRIATRERLRAKN